MKKSHLIIILLAGTVCGVVSAYITYLYDGYLPSESVVVAPVPEKNEVETSVEISSSLSESSTTTEEMLPEDIVMWYGADLLTITIAEQELLASVADTVDERQQGLSSTPSLPENIVKLFIFDTSSNWGFWMKDMNYPIDIIWLDEDKKIVHIVKGAEPTSYPDLFEPPAPARYVIETRQGFMDRYGVELGQSVVFDL